jgi:hypothetical protein
MARIDLLGTISRKGSLSKAGEGEAPSLEGVMNLLRNGLLMLETGDRHGTELTE